MLPQIAWYRDHFTNAKVKRIIQQTTGPFEDLLTTIKRPQTQMVRACLKITSTCKDNAACKAGGGKRGRQKKRWEDNIKELNRHEAERYPQNGRQQRGLERAGQKVSG